MLIADIADIVYVFIQFRWKKSKLQTNLANEWPFFPIRTDMCEHTGMKLHRRASSAYNEIYSGKYFN